MGFRTRQRFCICFVFGGWLVLILISRFLKPSPEVHFGLLFLQQTLFITGGILGSRRDIFQPLGLSRILLSLLWGLGLFLVNTVLGALALELSSLLLGSEFTSQLITQERAGVELFLLSGNPLLVRGVIFLLIVGAPLSEELFFRGLFLDFWKEKLGPPKAVIFAAFVFAVLHFYLVQFIPVLVAGILLGFMFIRSKTIYPSVIAHGVANALVLLILLATL